MIIGKIEGEDGMGVEGLLLFPPMAIMEMISILLSAEGIGSTAKAPTLPKQAHEATNPAVCACVDAVVTSSPRHPNSTPGDPL